MISHDRSDTASLGLGENTVAEVAEPTIKLVKHEGPVGGMRGLQARTWAAGARDPAKAMDGDAVDRSQIPAGRPHYCLADHVILEAPHRFAANLGGHQHRTLEACVKRLEVDDR